MRTETLRRVVYLFTTDDYFGISCICLATWLHSMALFCYFVTKTQ